MTAVLYHVINILESNLSVTHTISLDFLRSTCTYQYCIEGCSLRMQVGITGSFFKSFLAFSSLKNQHNLLKNQDNSTSYEARGKRMTFLQKDKGLNSCGIGLNSVPSALFCQGQVAALWVTSHRALKQGPLILAVNSQRNKQLSSHPLITFV